MYYIFLHKFISMIDSDTIKNIKTIINTILIFMDIDYLYMIKKQCPNTSIYFGKEIIFYQ